MQTCRCSFVPRITPIVRTRVIVRTTAFPSADRNRNTLFGRTKNLTRQSPVLRSTWRFIPHGLIQSRWSPKHVARCSAGRHAQTRQAPGQRHTVGLAGEAQSPIGDSKSISRASMEREHLCLRLSKPVLSRSYRKNHYPPVIPVSWSFLELRAI